MSSESDEDYASADEATNTSSGGGQCELQESQEPQSHSDVSASASNVEQPEVVKVVDNKYVSDAESVKNGGLVELSEEQRKVCVCVGMCRGCVNITDPGTLYYRKS